MNKLCALQAARLCAGLSEPVCEATSFHKVRSFPSALSVRWQLRVWVLSRGCFDRFPQIYNRGWFSVDGAKLQCFCTMFVLSWQAACFGCADNDRVLRDEWQHWWSAGGFQPVTLSASLGVNGAGMRVSTTMEHEINRWLDAERRSDASALFSEYAVLPPHCKEFIG